MFFNFWRRRHFTINLARDFALRKKNVKYYTIYSHIIKQLSLKLVLHLLYKVVPFKVNKKNSTESYLLYK